MVALGTSTEHLTQDSAVICCVWGLVPLLVVELLFELVPSEFFFVALGPSGFVFCLRCM